MDRWVGCMDLDRSVLSRTVLGFSYRTAGLILKSKDFFFVKYKMNAGVRASSAEGVDRAVGWVRGTCAGVGAWEGEVMIVL